MYDRDNYVSMQLTVLGTLIRDPTHIGEAMAKLSAELFDADITRTLYNALSVLYLAGSPIDPLTVRKQAGEDYGVAIDEALSHQTGDVLYYCDALRDYRRLVLIHAAAGEILGAENIEAAAKVTDKLNGLFVSRRGAERLTARDAANEFMAAQNYDVAPKYLSWGIDALDKGLFVEPGDFVVIGGYPSAGKTLLSLQFARHLAKDGRRVAYYSLETGAKKIRDRLISSMGHIPMSKIKRHEMTPEEWRRAGDACKELYDLPLEIVRASGWSVGDIQADALNHRYEVIFVDYLGIIAAGGKSRYEMVTNISIGLHTLAQAHGITVVALQQLSRPEKDKGKPRPPTLSDFRESGQIEQDADVAMLLYPSDPNDNHSDRVLKVSKNKDGDKLSLTLAFDGPCQTMTPKPQDESKEIMRKLSAEGRAVKAELHQQARVEQSLQVNFEDLPPGSPGELPF